MAALTDAEWRGARVLAVLLVLGTANDLWEVRHPRLSAPMAGSAARALAAPAAAEPPVVAGASTRAATTALDLNRADATQLDALPGIGPVLAARIVEHRRQHGPFRQVEELLAVPGIGPRLLARLRPHLREPAAAP